MSVWILLHVLLGGYWLGTDFAVYVISGAIVDPHRSPVVRAFAAKSMLWLDMVPRTCLVLTVPVGSYLALRGGWFAGGTGQIAAAALGGAFWLALTWAVFLSESRPRTHHILVVFDWIVRLLVVTALLAWSLILWRGDATIVAHSWLSIKVAVFAVIMALGLLIRLQLRPFGASLARALSDAASAADNEIVKSINAQVKVVVWVIWALLIACFWLGLAKPYFTF
jgi:hypothetical protein